MSQIDIDNFMNHLSAVIGVDYTDEQREFIKRFDSTQFCFASPGTGKTMSAIGGLLVAELAYKIPGNKIYAMSFTNMATQELASRHSKSCQKLGIRATPNFITLHKLCTGLLKEHYAKLGMTSITFSEDIPMQRWVDIICGSIEIAEVKVPKIVRAIHKLNSSLVFNPVDIKESFAFKECDVSYEVFEQIRGKMFLHGILIQKIPVSDILLCTLLLLNLHPEVSEAFRESCKLMLVDEAQDLSLLQLKIISMLAEHVVLIGDMKQQIYAFNGACSEIVDYFFKFYPEALKLQLSHSFRCKSKIAEYASKIIAVNDIHDEFVGVSEGGIVEKSSNFSLDPIVERIKEDYTQHNKHLQKDVLFLFRNNSSAIPIAEKLYAERIPFRVNNYQKIYELPVIKDLYALCALAEEPDYAPNIKALSLLIHELRQYKNVEQMPLYKIMLKTGKSVFDINYQFQDQTEATEAFNTLYALHQKLKSGCSVRDAFNIIYKLYEARWLKEKAFLLEYPPTYYINLVQGILANKTVRTMRQYEDEKAMFIQHCNDYEIGIRCYTMHAAKGLEADIVYVLDANDGMIPNTAKLQRVINKDCLYEAAKSIRNERSLCYVAATRAKDELYIYHTGKIAEMFSPDERNSYAELDACYNLYNTEKLDVETFVDFCKEYIYEQIK